MKLNTKIKEITYDELVVFFSTSLFGSSWLRLYDCSGEGKTIEDCIVTTLLNGDSILLEDLYSEGEHYGKNPYFLTEEGTTVYKINLKAVFRAFESVIDGKGIVNPKEHKALLKSLITLIMDDCDFDADMAFLLIQVVMFGEVIYG